MGLDYGVVSTPTIQYARLFINLLPRNRVMRARQKVIRSSATRHQVSHFVKLLL